MKHNRMRKLQGAAALTLAAALTMTGCDGSGSSSQQQSSGGSDEGETVTLSYWTPINSKSLASVTSYSELLCYQELEKKTGIHLDFQHPAVGQEKEQFNLLMVSGELPDLIEYNWLNNYPGGFTKAAEDGIIQRLNEAIEQYAPNLQKFIDENPDIAKQFTADDGSIYCIPAVSVDGNDYNGGFMIRQDWLDELNLEAPETMDDWTEVLRAFKEKKGATAPFTAEAKDFISNSILFSGAYGVGNAFYRDGETVKYGPMEQGYKDYLAQMNAWYEEGLLDIDFAANDRKAVDSKILGDQSGAMYGLQVGHMSRYLANKAGTSFNLVGVQFPVLNEGDEPCFGRKVWESKADAALAVTTSCENIEAVMRLADFLFSEEGMLTMTFGVEGDTYEMVDGQPVFTEKITNDPDGKSMTDAIAKYTRGGQPMPGFNSVDEFQSQTVAFQQQADAQAVWAEYADNATAFAMPPVTMTTEEAERYSKIMADITPYREEMTTKFILGTEPIENFDQFVENLKSMHIEEALEIQQAALDRYNAR